MSKTTKSRTDVYARYLKMNYPVMRWIVDCPIWRRLLPSVIAIHKYILTNKSLPTSRTHSDGLSIGRTFRRIMLGVSELARITLNMSTGVDIGRLVEETHDMVHHNVEISTISKRSFTMHIVKNNIPIYIAKRYEARYSLPMSEIMVIEYIRLYKMLPPCYFVIGDYDIGYATRELRCGKLKHLEKIIFDDFSLVIRTNANGIDAIFEEGILSDKFVGTMTVGSNEYMMKVAIEYIRYFGTLPNVSRKFGNIEIGRWIFNLRKTEFKEQRIMLRTMTGIGRYDLASNAYRGNIDTTHIYKTPFNIDVNEIEATLPLMDDELKLSPRCVTRLPRMYIDGKELEILTVDKFRQ